MKIFLDDERDCPLGRIPAKHMEAYYQLIYAYIDEISTIAFDHDLGQDYDGYDILSWTIQTYKLLGHKIPKIVLHTSNPSGLMRMKSLLDQYGFRYDIVNYEKKA